jgi:hypothetical protein
LCDTFVTQLVAATTSALEKQSTDLKSSIDALQDLVKSSLADRESTIAAATKSTSANYSMLQQELQVLSSKVSEMGGHPADLSEDSPFTKKLAHETSAGINLQADLAEIREMLTKSLASNSNRHYSMSAPTPSGESNGSFLQNKPMMTSEMASPVLTTPLTRNPSREFTPMGQGEEPLHPPSPHPPAEDLPPHPSSYAEVSPPTQSCDWLNDSESVL